MVAIAATIQRDFASVDDIQTVGMSDDPGARFDVVVVGSRKSSEGGWRVEVLSVDHHRLHKRWDSAGSATEPEFESSGPRAVEVRKRNYDYDLLIQGCVARLCGDGVDGFLFFAGSSGKTYKAKAVTRGLDKPVAGAPEYDVTYSVGVSDDARHILQDQMCRCSAFSNKAGLPFTCKGH
jgi:hypothetical protein